jgi:NAD(P)-dependent dehydrogenase (short-subunit alcohol dehydrogenase family)
VASELTGRHALVTGGSRGIGAAIAKALLAHGARVTLLGRERSTLEARAAELGHGAGIEVADVSVHEQVHQAIAAARARVGEIDILVNNAGQADSAPFHKTDETVWKRLLDVNLNGTYFCTHAVVPTMVARGFGRIVNVASTAGLTGYAYCTAYCAAKHAVVGLTRALALELATRGITVNAVCPGFTDTDIVARAVDTIRGKTGRSEAEAVAALVERNPQRRLVRPEEVANAVAWLCLPGAEAITGQSVAVAGGEVM